MDYRKIEIIPHKNGKKYFKISDLRIGERFFLKLHKFNRAISKEVQYQGKSFTSYALGGIYAGEEVMINLNEVLNSFIENNDYDLGTDLVFEAVKSDKGRNGKIYEISTVNKVDVATLTPDELATSNKIKELAGESGIPLENVDIILVAETLYELNDKSDPLRIYSGI